jgi:hypothetical protein
MTAECVWKRGIFVCMALTVFHKFHLLEGVTQFHNKKILSSVQRVVSLGAIRS